MEAKPTSGLKANIEDFKDVRVFGNTRAFDKEIFFEKRNSQKQGWREQRTYLRTTSQHSVCVAIWSTCFCYQWLYSCEKVLNTISSRTWDLLHTYSHSRLSPIPRLVFSYPVISQPHHSIGPLRKQSSCLLVCTLFLRRPWWFGNSSEISTSLSLAIERRSICIK